jgi:tetratricopeptide (TPR) repeat protein
MNSLVQQALQALAADPARAEALCRQAIAREPQNGEAALVLSEALRLKGDLAGARAAAAGQAKLRPSWFDAQRQLGAILAETGDAKGAARAYQRAAELGPTHPRVWRELGDQLMGAGETKKAQAAYARHGALPTAEPRLVEAARALAAGNHAAAEPLIREHLAKFGNDVAALRMLSDAQARAGRPDLAEQTLRKCLELAPGYGLARHALGQLLNGQGRHDEALAEARELLRRDAENKGSQRLLAAIQVNRGEYGEALGIYERHLAADPAQPTIWTSLGHVLKTVGRTEEAIAAYRKATELAPTLGVAYWSLADLKTFRFSDAERARMEEVLRRPDLSPPDRVSLHYALGKALEDEGDTARAFASYREGAALYRRVLRYDPDSTQRAVDRTIRLFTPEFLASRAGAGAPDADPIFVLGLPRSGSTLIEQILASHSAVEGTKELSDLAGVARAMLSPEHAAGGGSYLDVLARLDASALTAAGEAYLRSTRSQRKLGRVRFIDKMPNNWAYVGLIHLILPNARIIDARRHPLATGWSCFKQHFAQGQLFTYDLTDIGRYYADYVRLMAHWDAVLPRRVHRVIHQDLAADPEPHIRALLDYCGLPFEEACLRPHESRRAVMSASSEQVRRPISAKGVDDWRKFEPWLGELKASLGDTLETWRG